MIRRPFLLSLATLALAACGGDTRDPEAAADSVFVIEGIEENPAEPYLSPEDSARLANEQARRARELTERIRGEPVDTTAVEDTPEKQLASCLAQANSVDEPVRSTILKACDRFRTP